MHKNEGKGGEKSKASKRKNNAKKRELDYRGGGIIIIRSKSASQASQLLGSILQLAKEALEMGESLGVRGVENNSATIERITRSLKRNRKATIARAEGWQKKLKCYRK